MAYILRPRQHVLLNYFSMPLNRMTYLQQLWENMQATFGGEKRAFRFFYLFGATDVLMLGMGNRNDLVRMKNEIATDVGVHGVKDFFMHYGMTMDLYPEEFNFDKAINENPVIGIVTVKIREEAWEYIHNACNNYQQMMTFLQDIFRKTISKTCGECKIDSSKYKAVLLISYEIEDATIIWLTNSFQFIKKFSLNLRNVEFKNTMLNESEEKFKIKHIVASTNTTLGVNLLRRHNRLYFRDIASNSYDRINWWTDFEIQPGHMQAAINAIKNTAEGKKGKLRLSPITGKNDLSVYSPHNSRYSLKKFLDCHYNLFHTLADNQSVVSSETYTCFPNIKTAESERNLTLTVPDIDDLFQPMIQNIKTNSNLSVLEKESLINVVRKLQYLLNNSYSEGSFTSFLPLIKRGVTNYLKIPLSEKLLEKTMALEVWTSLLELAYIARYQGLPPVGETAVCPTLGTYSMGQKLLSLFDYTGHYLLFTLAKKLGVNQFQPQTILTTNINPYIATNIPCLPLNIAFILLPLSPLMHHDIVILSFFHELGHSVFTSFRCSASVGKLPEKVGDELYSYAEEFAEFFSCKVLSNLNFNEHIKLNHRVLKHLDLHKDGFQEVFKLKKKQIQKSQKLFETGSNRNATTAKQKVNCWMNLVANWDDNILQKIRVLLKNDSSFFKEFWNLWIFLNNKRKDYYSEEFNR